MAVSYNKMFQRLAEIGMSPRQMSLRAGFSMNILTRMRKNEYVSLESIEKICTVLDCRMEDIVEFVSDSVAAETRNESNYNRRKP